MLVKSPFSRGYCHIFAMIIIYEYLDMFISAPAPTVHAPSTSESTSCRGAAAPHVAPKACIQLGHSPEYVKNICIIKSFGFESIPQQLSTNVIRGLVKRAQLL